MPTPPSPCDVPAVTLLESRFVRGDLPRLRMLIDQHACREGLPESRRRDFVVAMDAVALNSIEHAGGDGTLLLQRSDGRLTCQIRDAGSGFSADVIPAAPPGLDTGTRGYGLWLARLLTDDLSVSVGSGTTVVTLTVQLPA
ncbi:MAG TPA: ATP-binding protein [Streptomyces sp.]|nr:ATP-binding protein [Streptomyces sp.]